jgi:hypothetical protein
VPQAVVDRLEVVDVDHQHGDVEELTRARVVAEILDDHLPAIVVAVEVG